MNKVFFRISLLVEEATPLWCFFAFLCLCKETLAKKAPLPPFPEKGVSPPKGGWLNRETHLRGYGHRRQSRLSAGKMG